MERRNELTACLIHNGTVTGHRDMIRALETVEGLTYRQILDGKTMAEGRATLVKLMADPKPRPSSSTAASSSTCSPSAT